MDLILSKYETSASYSLREKKKRTNARRMRRTESVHGKFKKCCWKNLLCTLCIKPIVRKKPVTESSTCECRKKTLECDLAQRCSQRSKLNKNRVAKPSLTLKNRLNHKKHISRQNVHQWNEIHKLIKCIIFFDNIEEIRAYARKFVFTAT